MRFVKIDFPGTKGELGGSLELNSGRAAFWINRLSVYPVCISRTY